MIGFRVDANEHIATGHLMRCMSIAQQCVKQGQQCIFLLAEDKETKRLNDKNIPYRILHTKWNDMESELAVMKQVIGEEHLDRLVVDSYQATKRYLEELNQAVKVMYLDDMAKEKYCVSALLHYSNWPDDKYYESLYEGMNVQVLSGMEYTPLREEFAESYISDNNRKKSILITTGGTDTYNVTGRFLKECLDNRAEAFKEYSFDVIVGNMNSYESQLRRMAEADSRIHIHKNIPNMSDYMRSCEMAVSAGGTTLFELCACQIPTVCFSFANNQKGFVEEMGKRKIMLCAGDAREVEDIEKEITNRIVNFMNDAELTEQYTGRMGQLVDGQGSVRIASFLCEK